MCVPDDFSAAKTDDVMKRTALFALFRPRARVFRISRRSAGSARKLVHAFLLVVSADNAWSLALQRAAQHRPLSTCSRLQLEHRHVC